MKSHNLFIPILKISAVICYFFVLGYTGDLLSNKVNNRSNYSVGTLIPLTPDDGKKAPQKKNKKNTKSSISADSLRKINLLKDSTARMSYFKYSRHELPFSTIDDKKQSSFFANTQNVRREIVIDSAGKNVIIKDIINGQESRISLVIPIDEYIELRAKSYNRDLWESVARKYETKQGANDDLKNFMSDFTNLDIPLPSLGLLSIFGKPGIKLRINGAVDIKGAWRNEESDSKNQTQLANSRSEPDFKQQVQISVDGTIGDKLKINADWDTERQFEYENRLKIKYTGYEDEIVQNVEAGNVSITGGSLIGGSEALFGIKADFKMGPLSLTAIASQKKAETQEKSLSGGGQKSTYEFNATDYSPNHFYADESYTDSKVFHDYFDNPKQATYNPSKIQNIEVWKYTNEKTNVNIKFALLYDSLKSGEADSFSKNKKTETARGNFKLLTKGVDYSVINEIGLISFKSLADEDIIGIAYTTEDNQKIGKFYADVKDTVILKLIKPKVVSPTLPSWKLQAKNIYSARTSNVKNESFHFYIKYDSVGSNQIDQITNSQGKVVKFLNAFNLDRYKSDGQESADGDGEFDFFTNVTILPATGDIIFPSLEPFGKDFPASLPQDKKIPEIYSKTKNDAKTSIKDRFRLKVEAVGTISSTIQIGFNIVENSVKVLLNGVELKAGIDYEVDYSIGQLTIKRADALNSGNDLKIKYEENDMAAIASKSLLGTRGVFDLGEKTKFGFTAMNYSQQTLSDKVKIGDEPINNWMFGVDLTHTMDLPFLTKLINKVIPTKEISSLNFRGELAMISPDGNTIKSTIQGDNNKSIAYVDDFEGGKRNITIGHESNSWHDLSAPYYASLLDPYPASYLPFRKELMNYKAKTIWYTPVTGVKITDIWHDREVASQQDQYQRIMELYYFPTIKGTYNYTPAKNLAERNWGGMMKYLSIPAKIEQENVEFIEFWFKPINPITRKDTNFSNSVIHIDIGREIDEDVIPNRELNTERDPGSVANILKDGKDLGLDGLSDEEERKLYNSTEADPAGDDYSQPTKLPPWGYNGTEGNANYTEMQRVPDTEDLDDDGDVSLNNNYYRYDIPLNTDKSVNPYIQGGGKETGNNGWYLMRIPIRDPKVQKIGTPDLQSVSYVRVWFENEKNPILLQMTEFNFVGSQWQKIVKGDSTYSISVMNVFDNGKDYSMPPGLKQETDRASTDQNVKKNEQSLLFKIKELKPGSSKKIVKYLYQQLNVFNYSEMKMFVHGDERKESDYSNLTYDGNSQVYLRFGADTSNYYEYRMPVKAGWNDMRIVFKDLTNIKQDTSKNRSAKPVDGKPGHYYSFKGAPSLRAIKFILVGVDYPITSQPDKRKLPINGDIWLDELRVLDIDNSAGYSYNASASLKIADIMNVSFAFSNQDSYFRGLSQKLSESRSDNRNWTLSISDLDVLKFVPMDLSTSTLKLNYSHTESVNNPIFLNGSDIKVKDAADEVKREAINRGKTEEEASKEADLITHNAESISTSDVWSLPAVKIKLPTNFWLLEYTLHALSLSFNYNKSWSRGPAVQEQRSWSWNSSLNYGITLSPNNYFSFKSIPLFGLIFDNLGEYKNLRLYFTPQSLNATASAMRTSSYSLARSDNSNNKPTLLSDFTTQRAGGFDWKITENGFFNFGLRYSSSASSTLGYLVDPKNEKLSESEIFRRILSEDFFGNDLRYSQSTDLRTNLKLPAFLAKYLSTTFSYGVTYSWVNNSTNNAKADIGRSVAFGSKLSATANLRYKSIWDPVFSFLNNPNVAQDTSKKSKRSFRSVGTGFGKIIYSLFFDYETFSINFSQDNQATAQGIKGKGHGFYNFFSLNQSVSNGPSRAFMLGLTRDPGERATGGQLTDSYQQGNTLDFRTNRTITENITLDLSWRVNWSLQETNPVYQVTSNKIPPTSVGQLTRSFLALPKFLFIKDGIEKVKELYVEDVNDKRQNAINLSKAFEKGFENLPTISKLGLDDIAKYLPQANWRITWSGLEKFFLFKSLAQRVSLEHAYTSNYSEGWSHNDTGKVVYSSQKVNYAFAPLVGLNINFNQFWGGNMSGSVKYNVATSYDLAPLSQNITEAKTRDIGISLSYGKSGFNIPFFGLNLKNDIDFSFTYTYAVTENGAYDFSIGKKDTPPKELEGSVRTSLEPKLSYKISTMVTTSIFYRRSKTEPKGASANYGLTTNEAGLEVHISIQ